MDTNWLYVLLQKCTVDPLERLRLGNVILNEVSQRKISPHPKLVNDFLDVMSGWLTGSNFKVTIIGLEILEAALRTSPEVLASYYFDRLAVLIERMGDAKPQVREMAVNLCLQLAYLENSSPVMILDRFCVKGTGFEHKQWLVKVGCLTILREFLAGSFALVIQQAVALIPQICRLTNDPNVEVRDVATTVLVDLMVFGGKPIVAKVAATKLINEQKMTILLNRYQTTVATRGDLPPKQIAVESTPQPARTNLLRRSLRSPAKIAYPSRLSTPPRSTGLSLSLSPAQPSPLTISSGNGSNKSLGGSSTSSPLSGSSPVNNGNGIGNGVPSSRSRDTNRSSIRAPSGMSVSRYRSSSCAPAQCAVSQDDFRKAFTAVPKVTIYSNSDIREKLDLARQVLCNANEDWSKRANQLKLIRSVVINSSDADIDRRVLIQALNELADALEFSVRDLRSQIVRESAVTCSFLLENFGMEVKNIGETVLAAALTQVGVSTKIMASSAATLTVFIVQKIPTRQVFTCLSDLAASKSKEQRRQLAHLLEVLIGSWDLKSKQPILKNIGQLVQHTICDADGETRVAGRKAFAKLEQLHGAVADQIFRDLDPAKQKMLRDGVSSSSSSLSNDRENVPQSAPRPQQQQQNISQRFLAQRSASAIDANKIPVATKVVTRPTGLMNHKLPKSSTSTSFSAVRSSGYGQQPMRSKTPFDGYEGGAALQKSSSSSPSTSTIQQTSIQRVASNLGSSSFVSSLTQEQASSLQNAMDLAKEEMQSKKDNDDDEFLLGNLRATPPASNNVHRESERGTPPVFVTTAENVSSLEYALKACASSSINEKRDALRSLSQHILDPAIQDHDLKCIGDTLSRLLAEGNNTLIISILECISLLVKCHFPRLESWLKLALGKLFGKMGMEALPNVKSALLLCQKTFLTTFDPSIQLKAVCDFMCDPVHLLAPKSRLALLEYICVLFEEIWPEDPRCLDRHDQLDTPYLRTAIRKMFAWMFDPRIGAILMPACERLVCALFAVNAADFSMIIMDMPAECRDWSYRILQLNGQQQNQNQNQKAVINEKEINNYSNNNYKPYPTPHDTTEEPPPLKMTYNSYESTRIREFQPTTFPERKSTAHLANNHVDQAVYIRNQLDAMREFGRPERVNEAMANVHGMMCEGAFTLWNQFFDELLDTVYQILSSLTPQIRKKLALRILQKMCSAQAAKLFDSTEIAIQKVLHCAVTSSEDTTISVASEDVLRILATHLPLPRIVNISKRILCQDDDQRAMLILKMLTRVFQEIDVDELYLILDDVAPCFVSSYDSLSSQVRKCAVFGLVALVQRIGMARMEKHLKSLNASKLNLIDLYVGRAKSSESGTSSN
uniref:TOG domain-containing protein n=1 Tax=Caenorhabditis japonica TaxID=281687 RepID=A0A8R1HQE1_CAEJA